MSLEDWEQYVAVKRVRAWGKQEEEWVSSLPPHEQDVVYELAAVLDVRPVGEDERVNAGIGFLSPVNGSTDRAATRDTPEPVRSSSRAGQAGVGSPTKQDQLFTRTPPGQLTL